MEVPACCIRTDLPGEEEGSVNGEEGEEFYTYGEDIPQLAEEVSSGREVEDSREGEDGGPTGSGEGEREGEGVGQRWRGRISTHSMDILHSSKVVQCIFLNIQDFGKESETGIANNPQNLDRVSS